MAEKFTGISTQRLNKILQTPTVTRALEDRAARVLPRTRAIAYQAGARNFAREVQLVRGTRPGLGAKDGLQRSYARIQVKLTDQQIQEDRRAKLTRRQILRRAAYGS